MTQGGVPREQKMLKGHLPRVIYHQVYLYTKIKGDGREECKAPRLDRGDPDVLKAQGLGTCRVYGALKTVLLLEPLDSRGFPAPGAGAYDWVTTQVSL